MVTKQTRSCNMEGYKQRVVETRRREVEQAYSRSSLGVTAQRECPLADLLIDKSEGTRVNGKLEGFCRAVFKDGNFYEGDFKEGIMHGRGIFTWTDGLIYEGEMNCSKITGNGTYTWPDGSTYSGDVVNGRRHGSGVYHSTATNTTYIGEWVNGKREGRGRLIFPSPDGDDVEEQSYYDGEWKDNKQHGTGIRRYRSGNVYRGEWREGVKEGEGEMEWDGGKEKYSGQWEGGKPHGHGVYIWQGVAVNHAQHPVSNRYDGEWKNGLRNGQGTFYYASGAVYRGMWREGVKEGEGTFTFKNGETFSGLFHRDHPSQQENGEEVQLRPKTPLSSLIGDSGTAQTEGASSSGRLDIIRVTYHMTSEDKEAEVIQVHSVILQHITQLKKIYHYYSSLGTDPAHHTLSLTRMQFWQLLKDCRVHHEGLSLWGADTVTAPPPPCPSATLLMREFLQALVQLAHHLYSHGMSQGPSVCLSYFLNTLILPHACSLTGLVFRSQTTSTAAVCQEKCWKLYQTMALKTCKDELYVTMRSLLWRFKECSVIPLLVSADQVVSALVSDQPLAVDEGDYNLDIKMTVLDVLEVIMECCESYNRTEERKITVDQVLSLLTGDN